MTPNSPLVSIVMPVYNGASKGMLAEAITSCLKQSYKNIELILVDDCSTDDTYMCIEKFMRFDKRIRVIRNSVNKKLPESLNIGFANAKGEYYTWTSDDNFYMPNAIEEMLIYLEKNNNISIVYADFICIDKDKKKLKLSRTERSELLFFYNCIGACFLYRREVHIALNGYDTQLFLVEDYDFWLRAYEKFEYMYIEKPLYYYTEHGQSLSATRRRAVCVADLQIVKKNIASNQCFSIINRRKRSWYAIKASVKYCKPLMAIYFCCRYFELSFKYYLGEVFQNNDTK